MIDYTNIVAVMGNRIQGRNCPNTGHNHVQDMRRIPDLIQIGIQCPEEDCDYTTRLIPKAATTVMTRNLLQSTRVHLKQTHEVETSAGQLFFDDLMDKNLGCVMSVFKNEERVATEDIVDGSIHKIYREAERLAGCAYTSNRSMIGNHPEVAFTAAIT